MQASCGCPVSTPTLQGSLCCLGSVCQPRINPAAHPVQYANDGLSYTYWQSSDGVTLVNVTVSLSTLYEMARVAVQFGRLQPYAMIVSRSLDGVTFQPLQVKCFL